MKKLFTNLKVFMTLCLLLVGIGNTWGETTYKLVTSTSDLKAGCKYIIGNGTDGSVNFMSTENNSNNRKTTSATVSESKVTATEDILVLELGGSTGAWTLTTTNYKGTNGYLASASSDKNYCRVISDATTATISFSDGAAVINLQPHSERTLLRYNDNNGTPIFACYSSGQSAIYMYKEEDTTPSTDATATFTMNGESIEFANNSYTKNVAWNADDAGGYSVAITPATGATVTDVDGASGDASPYNIAAPTAGSTSTAMFEITAEDGKTTEIYEINIAKAAAPEVTYSVAFDANGGEGTMNPIITDGEQQISLPECEFTYTGKVFNGWKLEGSSTIHPVESLYDVTGDVTFYAQWRDATQYTITWMVNGTSITTGNPTLSVYEGESITKLPTDPSIVNYIFKGWTSTQIATSSATAPTDLFTDAEHAPEITANTTFYAVFAEESEGDVTWNLANDIAANDVIIIATNKNNTQMKTAGTISSNLMSCTASTFNSDKTKITSVADGTLEFTLGGNSTSGWTLQNGTNYLGMSGDKKVALSSTSSTWSISISSGVATVSQTYSSKSYSLQYNYNNGNDRFTGYTSAQTAISLYKKTQEITYTYYTNVVVKELTNISLSGEYPTEFWKGDAFNHEGMTVTAHYDDESTKDVTSSATFTGYDMSAAGNQTVTVTYDTKSTTYGITVNTIANTLETAYTVAEAKAIIDANPAELATTEVYVKGKVSEIVTEWSEKYGNISFNVSADGETTGNQFQFYRNFKGADKAPWASETDVPGVGEDVIGLGKLTKHNTTYEFAEGNYIVSRSRRSRDIKISDVGYATAYIPFAATVEGATAYYVTVEGSSAKLHEIDGTIPANTGVVLKGAAGTAKFTESKDTPATVTGNVLEGTLEAKTQAELGETGNKLIYVLNEVGGKVGFYHLDGTLAANRAYMEVAVGVGVKAFFFDEEATGIQNSQFTIHNGDVMYNLNGQVVGKDYKGIVIVNGKKMLNK